MEILFVFFFNDTATTEIYTLSLHDALPICLNERSHAKGFMSSLNYPLMGKESATTDIENSYTQIGRAHV